MKDQDKTKEQLINELAELRRRITEFEASKSKHKILEKALREERLRGQQHLDIAGVIFVAINDAGDVTLINRKGCEILGYERDEIIGKNWFDNFIPERLRDEVKTVFQKVMAGEIEPVEYFDNPVLTGTCDERIISWHNAILKDDAGCFIGTLSSGLDITERVQLNEALRQSEKRYRSLFDDALDMIHIVNKDGHIMDANPMELKTLGYTREEFIGKPLIKIIHPDYRSITKEALKQVLKGEELKAYETALVTKNGEKIDVEVSATPQKIEGESIGGGKAILRDITLRKQAEEGINHLNAVLRAIRNVNQLIVMEKDRDRLIKGICDNLIATRGYYNAWISLFDESKNFITAAEAGLGAEFSRLLELLKRGDLMMCGRKALEQSVALVIENPPDACSDCPLADGYAGRDAMSIRLESGGKVYGIMSVSVPSGMAMEKEEQSLFEEVAGDVGFALHVMEEEEKRKRAEESLRESEAKYRLLVENANDAIFVAQDEVVKFPNAQAEKMTGYSAEELGKIPFANLIHPEDRDMVLARHQRRLKGEDLPSTYSFRIINSTGKELWVQINTVLIEWEKTPATLNFLRDITREKSLETHLQQAQKMEAIGTLAGGIAHDFNNILSSVIGYTELSIDEVEKGSLVQRNLREVLTAGNRAKDLVQQILTFSRQSDQELKPVQVKLIAKEALKLLRASLPTTIEIRQNIISDALILGDHTQIHQILMNLCTNAGHAMQEKGGILTVGLVNVVINSGFMLKHLEITPGSYLKLSVSDTGCGIAPDLLERIFDPFFTTKAHEGTGMGLAVVHGIVKSYGGVITVDSEPERGSTFNIFFPVIAAQEEGEIELEKPLVTGDERVLFVDDKQTQVSMGKQMLESLGYDVVTRTSSIEALELFKTKPDSFDLVITDMTMPNMTGDELAKRLIDIRSNIPVILCTGFSARIDEKKAAAMGVRAFVLKPFLKRDIAEIIRKVLDGN